MIIVTADQASDFSLSVVVTGGDGVQWDLLDGPVRLGPGVQLFGPVDVEHQWRDAPALDGSFWQGYRVPRGDVVMPVHMDAATPAALRALHATFLRSVHPSRECSVTVSTTGAAARTTKVRRVSGANPALDYNPFLNGHVEMTLDFAQPWPFWSVDPVRYEWAVADTTEPGRPPVNTTGERPVSNGGDVAVPTKWTAFGAFNNATFGVGSDTVTYSAAVHDGRFVVVNEDPRHDGVAVVDQDGVDRWANVTNRRFAAIQPGDSFVRLGVTNPGVNAKVRLEFTPAYEQAW